MTTKELSGISHELKFWQGFVKTERFLKGWVADCVTPELNHQVYDFIHGMLTQSPNRHEVSILDVGSGVVSILNGLVPKANLTAVDPLGELYELVFDYGKHKISPPLPLPAEELEWVEKYDIVHCSNAIDHTQNPMSAYLNLKKAVRPGGFLILQGFENEADYENWQGFHQWNVELVTDETLVKEPTLCIRGKQMEHSIGNAHFCKKVIFENNKSWFIWIEKK